MSRKTRSKLFPQLVVGAVPIAQTGFKMQRKSEDQLLKLGFKENQESYARLDLINATALHQLGVSAKTCFQDDLV